jgi:hypothetical protein
VGLKEFKYAQKLNIVAQTSVFMPPIEEFGMDCRKHEVFHSSPQFFQSSNGMPKHNFFLILALNFTTLTSIPLEIAKPTQLTRCQ